jgi:hypothetical protein
MSLLKNLKVVASPANHAKSPEQFRRNKLIGKLQEQLALAEAQLGGRPYNRMRWITAANAEGEPVRIQRPVRLKQWWQKNVSGNVLLTVRYGARPLVISNGMTAIEMDKLEDLPSTISTVIKAVDAGELDGELAGHE